MESSPQGVKEQSGDQRMVGPGLVSVARVWGHVCTHIPGHTGPSSTQTAPQFKCWPCHFSCGAQPGCFSASDLPISLSYCPHCGPGHCSLSPQICHDLLTCLPAPRLHPPVLSPHSSHNSFFFFFSVSRRTFITFTTSS